MSVVAPVALFLLSSRAQMVRHLILQQEQSPLPLGLKSLTLRLFWLKPLWLLQWPVCLRLRLLPVLLSLSRTKRSLPQSRCARTHLHAILTRIGILIKFYFRCLLYSVQHLDRSYWVSLFLCSHEKNDQKRGSELKEKKKTDPIQAGLHKKALDDFIVDLMIFLSHIKSALGREKSAFGLVGSIRFGLAWLTVSAAKPDEWASKPTLTRCSRARGLRERKASNRLFIRCMIHVGRIKETTRQVRIGQIHFVVVNDFRQA